MLRGVKYCQLDRIVQLVPGREMVAHRTLRADEEYLKDHFPRFPVMPGVMMLESLVQAATWVVRTGDDFEHPLAVLDEVRSVKFGDFLAPDETLEITATVIKTEDDRTKFKASATKDGRTTVSARLVIRLEDLPDDPQTAQSVRQRVRKQFKTLFGDVPTSTA